MRGCSCRGTAGFAHVSCLAEEAKILVAEAVENNLDTKVLDERWLRWFACSLCEQEYQGVVCSALGWACWKTYVGRPEVDTSRINAMTAVGNGLRSASQNRERLGVLETQLALMRRVRVNPQAVLATQGSISNCLEDLGRTEESLKISVQILSSMKALQGPRHRNTIICAGNLAISLQDSKRNAEALSLAAEYLPISESALGPNDVATLRLRKGYLRARTFDHSVSLDDMREIAASFEDLYRTALRVLGGQHPITVQCKEDIAVCRTGIARTEARTEACMAALKL